MDDNTDFSLEKFMKKMKDNSLLHDKVSKDLDEFERNHGKNAIVDFKELESFFNYLASHIDDHEVNRSIVRFMDKKVRRISDDIIK